MATLLGADGQPLRATRPAGTANAFGDWLVQSLTDRWTDATEDGLHGYLKSFDAIYRSQPLVSAVVDKLARRIATLPFGGFEQQPDGSRDMVAASDSLATLIRSPWPRHSSVHLNHHIAQSLFVHGNALLAKVRRNGPDAPPDMLWPIDWGQVSAYGRPGGQIEFWSTSQFDNVERWFRAEDSVHFAWGAPSGSEIGISPLEKLGVTIRLEDAAQRHQTAAFRNGNRPSLALTLPPGVKQEEMDRVEAVIDAVHKGPDQSGKTIVLAGGTTAAPLSLTPVEAALIDQRKLNREEVGMVYDLSGPLMNDLSHGTMANVEEMLKSLYRDVIPPWTELIVQTFQAQLLDVEQAWIERSVRFEYTDKLKGDPKDLAETLKTEVEAGLRTRNEARRILGLPPDGDAADPENPANQLSANVNNQAPIAAMQTGPPQPPALPPPPAAPTQQ